MNKEVKQLVICGCSSRYGGYVERLRRERKTQLITRTTIWPARKVDCNLPSLNTNIIEVDYINSRPPNSLLNIHTNHVDTNNHAKESFQLEK